MLTLDYEFLFGKIYGISPENGLTTCAGVAKLLGRLCCSGINLAATGSRGICGSWMCCRCWLFGTRGWSCVLCGRVTDWGNRIWRFEGLVCIWLISVVLSYLSSTEWCFAFCCATTKQGWMWLEAQENPRWPSLSVANTIISNLLISLQWVGTLLLHASLLLPFQHSMATHSGWGIVYSLICILIALGCSGLH